VSDFIAISRETKSYGILTTEDGMILMDHLEKVFGFNAPAFVPNADGSFDPIKAAIRDGQRQVYLHMKSLSHKATHEAPKKTKAKRE
jgi:hypothetical protein